MKRLINWWVNQADHNPMVPTATLLILVTLIFIIVNLIID